MPSETLLIDRKDFLKERKPLCSEPGEIVPARWTDSPATPSSHFNSRGSPSDCRWGAGRGPSDFRRPVIGHGIGKLVGIQRDMKGENSGETSASPNSSVHHGFDFVNNDDGVGTTGSQRVEKEISLGSSLDWKPLKWARSGSLSSRGSGFSHLSSCKIIGVVSSDSKMEVQQGNVSCLQSPSGDAAICATPKTPDEVNSRKKPRLGWGEGLAKYEKKKVLPDDIVDKENGSRNGIADVVSSSGSLLPSPSLPGKSPSLTGNSESASPTTSCSFACSLSPGPEEKTSITPTTVDNNTCNPSVGSQNHTQGLPFSLENLDLTEDFNLSLLLDELLQTDDTSVQGSGFAMGKLQVWKADISRKLEITESEIDFLEHELKSDGDSRTFMPASGSLLKQCNNKNADILRNISSVEVSVRKSDVILEDTVSPVSSDTRSEKAECSHDHVCKDGDGSQAPTHSSCVVSVGDDVYNHGEDKSYDSIFGSNKVISKRTSDELSKLLPTTHVCTSVLRDTVDSEIKKKVEMRKRFLKFKERVTTLKYRTFQYSWKENLRLLSVRSGAKSQKKFESCFRMGFSDHQKHRTSSHSRLSSSGGSLSLVPTKEVVEYANMLLSDSRVKTYRNVVKMPTFILDKKERVNTRFISDNGLVENPKDVEKERSISSLWTIEDTEMFLDKYTEFGKNFRKIASFFQHKTVADCVEFYYKNHKSDLFQKAKKSDFAKGKSCNTNNTYLVTSGKRLNRETGATSLDMLGAASAMVANVDGGILEQQSHDFAIYCNEQETAAADVLAGICGSISSEALGSCITSSVDYQKVSGSSKRRSLNDVDEETCSDDSCGEEINSSIWTDEEKSSFIKALKSYGKDFLMISRCMGTRSSDQCKLFFSKARKCLGLDGIDFGAGSEATTGANQGGDGGGGGSDQDDTCMVDSGSGISHDKSSMECKMDVEDSGFREEHAESERAESEPVLENPVAHDCEATIKIGEKGNLEGAADSEAANMEGSPQNTCSDSASGAKVEEANTAARESEHELPITDLSSVSCYSRASCVDLATDHGNNLDLNAASENFTCQETSSNGFMMSNLFPQDHARNTRTRDDVSSRLTFRKSSQRSSSIDDPQSKLKLDESLLLPRDGCLQMGTDLTSDAQQQRRSSSLDIEKPSRSGDVKLFGKIITNHPLPKANGSGAQQRDNLQLKTSYGFWDGNRIQTGFSSLPDSAMLLAKYPAAFSSISTLAKLEQNQQLHSSLDPGNEQCNNLTVVPGFQTRKLTNNRGPSYHAYGQPITVDKLLPEMPRRKGI